MPRHGFITTADNDQFLFQQFLNGIVGTYTSYGLYLSFGYRLFISNDRKSFHGSGRKFFQKLIAIQLSDGFMKFLFGQELPATAALYYFKGIEFSFVFFNDAF